MASEAITRNDLKNVLDVVLPVYSGAIHKVLYDSGSTKVSSGTLTLSEPYTNFDYLIVSYLVNVDAYTEIFDCTRIQAYPSHSYQGDIVIYNGTTAYASTCRFTVTDATHLAVTNSGNNSNFVAGIVRVVGIKNPLVSAGITDLADYIVEQGTDGIWTYRKWNSGIAECWGILPTQTLAITQTWGSIYSAGSNTIRANFPTGLFVSAPVESFAIRGSDSSAVPCFGEYNSATQTSAYQFVRGTASSVSISLSIHAIGRWK